jgi:long-chain acyl-CoA synthetase
MTVFDSIPRRVQLNAQHYPHTPAYYTKSEDRWLMTNWADHAQEVRVAARALIALGLQPGQAIGLLGFNRPEWTTLALAAMSARAMPAGIYTTCSAVEVQYILHHADAPIVLLEDDLQWQKIRAHLHDLPSLRHVIMMRGAPTPDSPLAMSWEQLLSLAPSISDAILDDRLFHITPEETATLIYTSGTTGPPKAVMLSHHNVAWTAHAAQNLVTLTHHDRSLSYLPLSHIAEQMFTIHGPTMAASSVYYAQSIERVPDNLKEVQPTVFFGVPRIWEKFHAGISQKLSLATGPKAKLVAWAQTIGRRVTALRNQGRSPEGALALQYALAKKLVFSKLKPAIGMGSARICVSGAAPIDHQLLEFFSGFDLPIFEVYGQSEDCGPTSFNLPAQTRYGTVGRAIPGVEVAIAPDGEILVRGPNVFLGYYKDLPATQETLIDGWLHSGDLGQFDDDGFLYITGRKKELIITAGGKNVAPKVIEEALKRHPLINEAVVIGDRRKYLVTLLTLEPSLSAQWAQDHHIPLPDLPSHPLLLQSLQAHVDACNADLARVEQIKKFHVLERNLTVDDGELTPSLKVKRRVVYQNWADAIERLYAD